MNADSCPLLVEMLQENKTLKAMSFDYNHMSDEALLALGEGLKNNRGLQTQEACIEGAGVGVWQQFVLCLKGNRHLTELNVHDPSTLSREAVAVNETRQQQGLPLLRLYYRL